LGVDGWSLLGLRHAFRLIIALRSIYLALLLGFYELHASLLENTTVLEISRVSFDVCLPSRSVLPGTWFTSVYLSSGLSTAISVESRDHISQPNSPNL